MECARSRFRNKEHKKSDPRFRGSPSPSATGPISGLDEWDRPKRSPDSIPPKASFRQCPLPSGASSIDLEDSQSFMKSDHETSDFGVRRSYSSLRGPVRSFSLFYTRHGGSSQVLPEMDHQPFGRSRLSRSRISAGVTRTSGHHDSSASSPAARDASIPSAIPLRRSPRRTISGANPPSAAAL